MSLSDFIASHELTPFVLSSMQTQGFLSALAAAPQRIDPTQWLSLLWGATENAPFSSHEEFEQYAQIIVDIWEQQRQDLLSNNWVWPEECGLSDELIVNEATRTYCEGLLQGYAWTKEDWDTLTHENALEPELLEGVLLSISLLFDPDAAISAIEQQGGTVMDQFNEIFDGMPVMLSGLTQRAFQHVQRQENKPK